MKNTSKWWIFFSICLIITADVFLFPQLAFATQYQQCATDSTCTIGEFLYDDNYQTISVGTTCTVTSRYPNGDLLLNAIAMNVSSDGYYSYSVGTSGLNNDIYRTQMCCLTGTENICLDKTFEISAITNSLIADVWTYPNRALTSFGSLVTTIWSNPSRQLTSSTLENGTSLATADTVNSIGTSLSTLSAQVSTVQVTITTVNSKVDSLQTSVNSIQSDTTNILNKWSTYSVTDVINYIDSLETQLGNNTQTCSDDTTFGNIACLIDKWGTDSASTIYTAANNAYTTATTLRSELNFNGKSTTAYDEMIAIKAYIDTIESSIGSASDTSSATSIFGRIKQVKEGVDAIDNSTLDLNDFLAKWGDYSATDIYDKVKNLSSDISSINTVNNVNSILNIGNSTSTDLVHLKNQTLALKALLDVNRTMLESLVNQPIIKSWLEEGSIIFKNLITNPSKSISQDVAFVYYFPPEVNQDHIIKKSDSLEIKYDPAKSAYFVTGDYKLKPGETIILEVEVEDIWTIPQDKIDSLKKQADELFVPLKNTSYFAQGTTLHSDILVALDKIVAIQKKAQLPEDKINGYGQSKIEMDSVFRQMESLKNIVSSAGSIGTLSGFIGGVQTLGVWGITVVLVAGFVFLALYIKSLYYPKRKASPIITDTHPIHRKSQKDYRKMVLAAVFGLSLGISSSTSYYLLKRQFHDSTSNPTVLSAITTPFPQIEQKPITVAKENFVTEPEIEAIIPTNIPTPIPVSKISFIKKVIVVSANTSNYVNLRSSPDRNSAQITSIASGQELNVIAEKYNEIDEKWYQVTYNQFTGWILAGLTQDIQALTIIPSAKINIIVPAHDTIYLYSKPSYDSSITSKITQSQPADILVETKRWAKVILSRVNIEGWVSQDFIQKDIP